MNKLFTHNICLNAEGHKYFLRDKPEVEFISCTRFIDLFFEKFDSVRIANHLTSTHPNYIGKTAAELIGLWENARDEGTKIHEEIDNYISKGVHPEYLKAKSAAGWLNTRLSNDREFFSEVKVFSEEMGLAGTIDLLVHKKSKNTWCIYDWKTNKTIDLWSFNGKTGTEAPTSNLMDCNFIRYSLQLSIYRYLLEEYYGLRVEETMILHLTEKDTIEYKTDYFRPVILEMFKFLGDANKQKELLSPQGEYFEED